MNKTSNRKKKMMEANDMTLDEAIAHCNEIAGACDTACRREHKQLADWLRELKGRRRHQGGDAAAMREALEDSQSLLESFSWGEYGAQVREQMRDNRAALAKPARNCAVRAQMPHGEESRNELHQGK